MRLTLSKKLGLSFSVIIGLMAVSAFVAYVKVAEVEETIHLAVDESYPTAMLCSGILTDAIQSTSSLRGFLLLGGNPKQAEYFKSLRAEAWKQVDDGMNELNRLSSTAGSWLSQEKVAEIASMLKELKESQEDVERVAFTDQNIPSKHLMDSEAQPRVEKMRNEIAAILAEETGVEAGQQRRELMMAITEFRRELTELMTELGGFLSDGNSAPDTKSKRQFQKYVNAYQQVAAISDRFDAKQKPHWKEISGLYAEFEPLPERIITLRGAADWNKANYIFETKAFPQGSNVRKTIDQFVATITGQVKEHRRSVSEATAALTNTLLVATLIAVVIGSVVGLLFSRQIVAGIQSVVARAHRIATGDLSGDDIVVRSHDELGELAVAFNDMRSSLRDLAGQIGQATENVSSTAAEILASTQQQAAATKQQAATVQEITGTIEEINQSGAQIGDRAKQVSATVEATSSASAMGLKATEETSQTMETIRTQVEEVAENIVALCERTQTIGEIIATVSDIAEQSNLLALNASIEAASAGSQGGRFSVVAHEMKNLADRAKDCTVQVRTILGEVQKGINSSVMLTEGAVKRVESGKQKAGETENTIRQMSDMTERSIQAFQQILGGTNQQQIGVAQVTQGMQDIRQAVTQTAAGTAQLEKAAANLNALSHQLRSAVERYRV